jgi:hypothetical protein
VLKGLVVAAALMITFGAATEPARAAISQFPDGRYVKTNGNFCTSYLPGSSREFRVPLPRVMGFRNGPNKVQITPHLQYSYNLTNPAWTPWFSLPPASFSSNASYLTDMIAGQWVQWLPDAASPYVVRTVYELQWAIYNTSNQIIGWTAPYKIAEDYSTYSIYVGTNNIKTDLGCLIY